MDKTKIVISSPDVDARMFDSSADSHIAFDASTPAVSRKSSPAVSLKEKVKTKKNSKMLDSICEAIKEIGVSRKGASYNAIKKWVSEHDQSEKSAKLFLTYFKKAFVNGIEAKLIIRKGPSDIGLRGYFTLAKEPKVKAKKANDAKQVVKPLPKKQISNAVLLARKKKNLAIMNGSLNLKRKSLVLNKVRKMKGSGKAKAETPKSEDAPGKETKPSKKPPAAKASKKETKKVPAPTRSKKQKKEAEESSSKRRPKEAEESSSKRRPKEAEESSSKRRPKETDESLSKRQTKTHKSPTAVPYKKQLKTAALDEDGNQQSDAVPEKKQPKVVSQTLPSEKRQKTDSKKQPKGVAQTLPSEKLEKNKTLTKKKPKDIAETLPSKKLQKDETDTKKQPKGVAEASSKRQQKNETDTRKQPKGVAEAVPSKKLKKNEPDAKKQPKVETDGSTSKNMNMKEKKTKKRDLLKLINKGKGGKNLRRDVSDSELDVSKRTEPLKSYHSDPEVSMNLF